MNTTQQVIVGDIIPAVFPAHAAASPAEQSSASPTARVSAPVTLGQVTGRNGTFPLGAVEFTESASGQLASLDFVSRATGTRLNAGAALNIDALDALCLAWCRARGLSIPAPT